LGASLVRRAGLAHKVGSMILSDMPRRIAEKASA
jgi:hypothetical protein